MNSWRWQINGSIISAVCHQCDSKCYSNEAVIIVKLRGSILSKGGCRERDEEETTGPEVRVWELKVTLLTSSTCWRLGCPSTMPWIIPVSWNRDKQKAVIRAALKRSLERSTLLSIFLQANMLLWPSWVLLRNQPQQSDPGSSPAAGKGTASSQTQKCSGAPTHTTKLKILSMAGSTGGPVSCITMMPFFNMPFTPFTSFSVTLTSTGSDNYQGRWTFLCYHSDTKISVLDEPNRGILVSGPSHSPLSWAASMCIFP